MNFIIGAEIKKIVKKRGIKYKAFADLMNMEERNLYHFFKKENIDIDQIMEASKVLDYDFLTLYISNSRYKNYFQKLNADTPDQIANEPSIQNKKENQISFSITIKGTMSKVAEEMSNFLQSVKEEADKRGFEIQ